MPDESQVLRLLEERLTPYRRAHSHNVAGRAVELARLYGADEGKARLAGLTHDICKDIPHGEQLRLIEGAGIAPEPQVLRSPQLYHAIAGACYLESALHVRDEDVLNAVRYHTTARAGMSVLEQVVYLADLTSAERDYPDVAAMRALSEKGLREGMLYALQYILAQRLIPQGRPVCSDTIAAYNELVL